MSDFARRQFEAAGIAGVANRVTQGERLALDDAQHLAEAPLPLLAKVVNLLPDRVVCECPAVDPVVYLPLAEWTESHGQESALSKATKTIHEAATQLAELNEQDERVREFGDCVRTLHVVSDAPKGSALLTAIEAISRDATRAGISVSHLIRPWTAPETVVAESLAADAMRAVAIARLTSDDSEIRVPVGWLGIKAAALALSFGASHLGEVAVNAETAAALHIPTLAELADALRYDTVTNL